MLWTAGAAAADDVTVARQALADRLYPIAERHLAAALSRAAGKPPQGVEPLLLLCRVLSEQNRHEEVLAALDAMPAVEAAAADRAAFAFWRASALLAADRVDEALAAAEAAPPARAAAYATGLQRVRGRALVRRGDLAAARRAFEAVDRSTSNQVERSANLLEWASAELAAGEPARTVALMQREAAGSSTNCFEPGQLLRGQALRRLKRTDEAEAVLRQLASSGAATPAGRADAWLELAGLAADAGRTNDVVAAGRQALRLASTPDAVWRTGLRYGSLLMANPALLDEASVVIKRAIREQPGAAESATAQLALADACLAAGRNSAAAAEYQIYLETYGEPERVAAALRGRGWALLRLGSYGEAALVFEKAAEASSGTDAAECLLKAGDAMHADGRYGQATDAYRRVAARWPDGAFARRALYLAADATERMGDTAGAEAAFAALAEREHGRDEGVEALLRLAGLRQRRNAIDDAVGIYSRVLDTASNAAMRAEALIGRGRVRYRVFRFEDAIQDFSRAQREFPGVAAEAAYWEAMSLYGLGRDEDACRACEAFLARHPTSPLQPDAVLWLAKYRYNRGEFEAAQQLFVEYANRWPAGGWGDAALVWAGRAASRRSEYRLAVELLSRQAREYPGSRLLAEGRFVQGEALCELARFEEAILVFDEIINRFAESDWVTWAWGRKGDGLFSLGADDPRRYEEAMAAYRVVTARPDVLPDQLLQAEFKIGRCLEKLDREDDALDRYYAMVVWFLRERTEGIWHNEAAQTWFVLAAFQAAELLSGRGEYEQAVRVLARVEQADVAGKDEARKRIERIQAEHRWNW